MPKKIQNKAFWPLKRQRCGSYDGKDRPEMQNTIGPFLILSKFAICIHTVIIIIISSLPLCKVFVRQFNLINKNKIEKKNSCITQIYLILNIFDSIIHS